MFGRQKKNPRERFSQYLHHALLHLKRAFIPHEHNNHWPHVLRSKALISYGVVLIVIKILVTSILFISFPDPAALSQKNIDRILELTNEARQQQGLEPLRLDSYLSHVAQKKADDMATKNYFSHYTPEGYAPWYFIDTSEYPYLLAGENLAMNFSNADAVQRAFMASPSHRENILNQKFEDIGLAIRYATIDGSKTQVLVEYFGTRTTALVHAGTAAPQQHELSAPPPKSVSPKQETAVIAGEVSQPQQNAFSFSKELIVFPSIHQRQSLATRLYAWSHQLFIFFLAFLIISLAINLIVKIRIQHGRLILQSMLLILLVIGLLYTKIHFLEDLNLVLQIQ